MNDTAKGHIAALFTIVIWGTSFVATRMLLDDFRPIEIIFFRFAIGLVALLLAYPRRLRVRDKKEEWLFAAAGFCGVALYFLFENFALMYTSASNVGVVVAVSPFFTALLAIWFLDDEKPKANFFVGFAIAMAGIGLISFNGIAVLALHPLGDILAVLAACAWAVYSILLRKIAAFGYNTVQTTRRIFGYGLLWLVPAVLIFPFDLGPARFAQPGNVLRLLFLGLGSSALCFATWNFAVRRLGAVKTSIYIYSVPVVAVVASVVVLAERVTWMSALGTVLTLGGLGVSEGWRKKGKSAALSEAQPKAPYRNGSDERA